MTVWSHRSSRKCASGSVGSVLFPFSVTAAKASGAIILAYLGDQPGARVEPQGTYQVLEFTKIRSWDFWNFSSLSEGTGSSKHIGVRIGCACQSLCYSLCYCTLSKLRGNRRAITKSVGHPTAPTFMQTPISDTVRPSVGRVRWVIPPLTPTYARHSPCLTR